MQPSVGFRPGLFPVFHVNSHKIPVDSHVNLLTLNIPEILQPWFFYKMTLIFQWFPHHPLRIPRANVCPILFAQSFAKCTSVIVVCGLLKWLQYTPHRHSAVEWVAAYWTLYRNTAQRLKCWIFTFLQTNWMIKAVFLSAKSVFFL